MRELLPLIGQVFCNKGIECEAGSPVTAASLPARGRPPQAAARRPALRM